MNEILDAVSAGLKLAATPEGLAVIRQVAIRPDITADELVRKVQAMKDANWPDEAPDAPARPKE